MLCGVWRDTAAFFIWSKLTEEIAPRFWSARERIITYQEYDIIKRCLLRGYKSDASAKVTPPVWYTLYVACVERCFSILFTACPVKSFFKRRKNFFNG